MAVLRGVKPKLVGPGWSLTLPTRDPGIFFPGSGPKGLQVVADYGVSRHEVTVADIGEAS